MTAFVTPSGTCKHCIAPLYCTQGFSFIYPGLHQILSVVRRRFEQFFGTKLMNLFFVSLLPMLVPYFVPTIVNPLFCTYSTFVSLFLIFLILIFLNYNVFVFMGDCLDAQTKSQNQN